MSWSREPHRERGHALASGGPARCVYPEKMAETIEKLEAEMREAAKKFEFERAAQLRDKARALRAKLI